MTQDGLTLFADAPEPATDGGSGLGTAFGRDIDMGSTAGPRPSAHTDATPASAAYGARDGLTLLSSGSTQVEAGALAAGTMTPRTASDATRDELATELAGVIAQRDGLHRRVAQLESLLAAATEALALSNTSCRQLQEVIGLLSERIEDVARSPLAVPVRSRLRATIGAPRFARAES
jgi:hypothetical protein